MVHRITQEQYRVTKWGGGLTRELAIAPRDAVYADRDFLWRISSATVELEESNFTPLPDYNRFLSTLDGEIDLDHGDDTVHHLTPGQIYEFDGGIPTHSRGVCTDFNLMLRKGRCTGSMDCFRMRPGEQISPMKKAGGQLLVYCVRGTALLSDSGETTPFSQGEALLLDTAEAPVLSSEHESVVMTAEMHLR